jgi:ferritin
MVAYFNAEGLDGMATWMTVQTQEEVAHAMRFFNHLNERGGRVELLPLAQPQKEWTSPLEAFKAAYGHEQFISETIDNLVNVAEEENDNPAKMMLQWFVAEQVEEEDSTRKVVELLERIGDSGHGLIMVDRELGVRQAAAPSTEGGAA